MVGIGQVIEDCEVDGEYPHRSTAHSKCMHNPMSRSEECPPKPEEADG